jgi:hypothetical protein
VARIVGVAYTSVVAAGLGLLWVGISLGYLVTHDVPQPIVDSGHPTGVVFAIDLVFIVPPMLIACVWLVRKSPLGWVLACVMSIGGSMYTLSLTAASIEVARRDVGPGSELPIWAGLTVLGVVTASLLVHGIADAEDRPRPPGRTGASVVVGEV